tara:strand:- start:12765 stop:13223 length:459 start_codon:yes stop_codon:yes gene_type:complete
MINIKLDDSHISINDDSKSKKSILEKASLILSNSSGINKDILFNKLYEREKLGSTSVGNGVALPHARVEGIEFPFISVVVLENAIDFDNIDNLDVDIVLCLIVPHENSNNHIELLASLSEVLDQISIRRTLRQARNSEQIINCLRTGKLKFI